MSRLLSHLHQVAVTPTVAGFDCTPEERLYVMRTLIDDAKKGPTRPGQAQFYVAGGSAFLRRCIIHENAPALLVRILNKLNLRRYE